MYVIVDQDDEYPIDSDWNAQHIAENAAVITPADGSAPITMSLGFLKNAARSYAMIMMPQYWPDRAYDWKAGDNIKINGSISGAKGTKIYTTKFSGWDFTFDGKQFSANFNRQELIQKVIDGINNLGEAALTSEWLTKLNTVKSDAERLTPVEVDQIDAELLARLYKQDRAYRALLAESQGKTVHRTTLTEVTATCAGNGFDTGAIIHYSNEYIEYAPYAGFMGCDFYYTIIIWIYLL